MIYLFNDVKELTGTVRNNHILNLLYEREKNGIYSVSAEIPVTYNDQGTVYNYSKKIQKSDFLGHYDKEGRFQLHKIAAVDIENGSILVKGIHIFFDEAKAGAIIKDRRFVNREIIDGARVAFESIGWSVADFDVSVGKTYNFYNVTPLEARQILVETFGFEFEYWLDFDGKKVTNRHVAVKEKIGEKTNKRYTYGHNVLNIRAEQDYSEIYTAVIGRGKGEEIEETGGYGRRIEYTDVVWSKPSKPLNKPAGTRVLEDPNATQLFGYKENGVVKPRVKVEVFSDIESPTELIQASYEWLMDNNVPKAVFSLKVADGDGLNLGDEVYVIYRDIDLIKSARVEKVIDDLVSGNRDVEFGDTAYFDTDRRLSGLRADLKRYSGETGDRIYRLKMEFNRRFDEEVSSWVTEFEQNLIDQKAEIEADRENMTNLIEGTRTEFTEKLNAEITQTKEYAEQQAQAKADSVKTNLDSFKDSHQQLYDEVTGNILDIDTFLGDKSKTLNQQFDEVRTDFGTMQTELEESISNTRTALEGKIATTEEALGKVGEDLGNTKTDFQNQLDEARAELDGLEIGGRNLLPAFTSDKWTHTNLTEVGEYSLYFPTGHAGNSILFMDVEKNTNYTMTFNSDYARYYIYEVLEDGSLGSIIRTRTGSETYTFNTEDISRIRVSINTSSGNVQEEKNIWNMQLEKGTVATDWAPAPEDTDSKITNINQTITNIEGELSSKVEQTEVDALKGTVTAQGTLLSQTADEVSSKAEKSVVDTLTGRVTNTESSVTQNAAEIAKKLTKSVYDSDKKDTDAKITQWSNTASETAEGLTRVIGRVSETEKGIDTAQTRIEAEAGRIDGLLSRTSNVEGKVRDAELAIEANADGLALRATKTEVEQAIDGIEVGGRNLILDSAKELSGKGSRSEFLATYDLEPIFEKYGTDRKYSLSLELKSADTSNANSISVYMQNGSGTKHNFVNKRVEVSEEYRRFTFEGLTPSLSKETEIKSTLAFYGGYNTGNTPIVKNVKLELGNKATDWTPAPEDIDASISKVTDRVTSAEAELKVQAGEISQKATQSELDRVTGRVSTAETSITQNATEIARRLVKSDYDTDKAKIDGEITKWSNLTTETAEGLEQTISRVSTAEGKITKAQADIIANADEIALKATQSDLDSVSGRVSSAESELSVQAGQIALRATKKELEGVDGRVSATEASLTVQDEKISGLVSATDGHSEKIAGIEADADTIKQSVSDISKDYVKQSSVKVTSDRVTIGSTVVNGDTLSSVISVSPTAIDLISDKIDVTGNVNIKGGVTALAVDAIEGNFSRLFANELTTDVIKASHIQASTTLVDKLFSYSARIDELITKTHFVNSMHALTLDVIDLNAANIRTRILSANTIEAEWLKSGTALLDKVFASTAMFERMMAKSAFVSTLNAVSLDLSQLTIWRPDGVAYMQNGLVRHGFDLLVKQFSDGDVTFTGQNYETLETSFRAFEMVYLNHAARYLKLQLVFRLSGSATLNSEYMFIRIRDYSGNLGNFSKSIRKLVRRGESVFEEYVIDLGKPTYVTGAVTLEFRRDASGTGTRQPVQARTGRVWLHDWE